MHGFKSSFNPNKFVEGISQKDWNILLESKNQPLANKTISGNYPPGSTFKMIVAIAALEENLISEEELFDCKGFYELEKENFIVGNILDMELQIYQKVLKKVVMYIFITWLKE